MVSTCGKFLWIEHMNNLIASFLRVDLTVCWAPVPRTVAPFAMDHSDAARPTLELKHQPLYKTCGESKNTASGTRYTGRSLVARRSLLTATQFLSSARAPRQLARSPELPKTVSRQRLPIGFGTEMPKQQALETLPTGHVVRKPEPRAGPCASRNAHPANSEPIRAQCPTMCSSFAPRLSPRTSTSQKYV